MDHISFCLTVSRLAPRAARPDGKQDSGPTGEHSPQPNEAKAATQAAKIPSILRDCLDAVLLATSKSSREKRGRAWEEHVNMYNRIASGIASGDKEPPLGITRIKFLAGHLDILDRKFGSLVTFHGLLATLAGLYLNYALHYALPQPVRQISFFFLIFAIVWFFTTVVCLLGMVRAKWGDLGKDSVATTAEKKHVEMLIKSVVFRTAYFRLAVPLTIIEVISLVLSIGISLRSSDSGSANHSNPQPFAAIGPFTSGVGCSTRPKLQGDIADAVLKIQRNKLSRIRVVGVTDSQPISKSAVIEYGNNVGLTLTRARCVAGWLTDSLASQGLHVEMTLAVRDPADRSSNARDNGTPIDRIVQIFDSDAPQ